MNWELLLMRLLRRLREANFFIKKENNMPNNQSKIDQVLSKLCPNGVEFKLLWEIEDEGIIKLGRGNVKIKNITFTQDYDYSYNAWTEKDIQQIKKTYSVECDFIWNIIKRYKPDGIKMDIEWAEREILKYLIVSKDFQTFKKWIMELHFRNNEDHKIYKELIQYLNKNDYLYELFDNDWIVSKYNDKTRLLNIYFNKKNADR